MDFKIYFATERLLHSTEYYRQVQVAHVCWVQILVLVNSVAVEMDQRHTTLNNNRTLPLRIALLLLLW